MRKNTSPNIKIRDQVTMMFISKIFLIIIAEYLFKSIYHRKGLYPYIHPPTRDYVNDCIIVANDFIAGKKYQPGKLWISIRRCQYFTRRPSLYKSIVYRSRTIHRIYTVFRVHPKKSRSNRCVSTTHAQYRVAIQKNIRTPYYTRTYIYCNVCNNVITLAP